MVTLAGTPDKFTVFHAYNCHHVHMANVLAVMEDYGIGIRVVKDAEFQREFDRGPGGRGAEPGDISAHRLYEQR